MDGKSIQLKRLLRSGEVVNLPDDEKQQLVEEYGLKLIIDFRTKIETVESPDDVITGVEYLHIDILEDAEDRAPSMENFSKISDEKQAQAFMEAIYGMTISDENSQKGYALFIKKALENKEGSILFHCFAGKDRTGIGAAILLTLLGVSREDIFEDYLKTNELRAQANKAICDAQRKAGKSEQTIAVMNEFLCVQKEYLECVYDIAERQSGSLESFIRETMGVTGHMIEELKANYLE